MREGAWPDMCLTLLQYLTNRLSLLGFVPQPNLRVLLRSPGLPQSGHSAVDVILHKLVAEIANRSAQIASGWDGRPEVHAAPQATDAALFFELGPRLPGAQNDVARRRDARFAQRRTRGSGHRPSERV